LAIGLVLRLFGDGLIVEGLVERGIDLGEHVALLHVLAFREAEAQKAAVDLGADRHRIERLNGADGVDRHRNVLDPGLCGRDAHRFVPALPAGALAGLRRGSVAFAESQAPCLPRPAGGQRDRQRPDGHQNTPVGPDHGKIPLSAS
jgi:hypothetical protein